MSFIAKNVGVQWNFVNTFCLTELDNLRSPSHGRYNLLNYTLLDTPFFLTWRKESVHLHVSLKLINGYRHHWEPTPKFHTVIFWVMTPSSLIRYYIYRSPCFHYYYYYYYCCYYYGYYYYYCYYYYCYYYYCCYYYYYYYYLECL